MLIRKKVLPEFLAQWDLQILVLPAILLIFIFSYIPIYGIVMAFQEYKLGDVFGFSQFVGLKQFMSFFTDPNTPNVLMNTIGISLLKLVINFPLPIIFAVALNEIKNKRAKSSAQTISYLPHFISWVVTATIMFDLMSTEGGAVNDLLMALGIIKQPIGFFMNSDYFWWIAVFTDAWKELGWSSIIFIAAIAGIDVELYEAADVDGATRLQKIWYITLACIRPTIILLFIFTVGNLLNANFDQIMTLTKQMTNPFLMLKADVIDTYSYRVGISAGRYSYGAAIGLFKSVINIGLLFGANAVASKFGDSALF